MSNIQSIIQFTFYISAAVCAYMCIAVASAMSASTCKKLKACLKMVTLGLVLLVVFVFYEITGWPRLVAILPILLGLSGWLFLDSRYRKQSMYRGATQWANTKINGRDN